MPALIEITQWKKYGLFFYKLLFGEFAGVWLIVAGRGSRVAGRGSRVQSGGRGSNVAAGENDLGFEVWVKTADMNTM